MPVIDGLDYGGAHNPVELSGNETIIKRLETMQRQIETDAPAYDQCRDYVHGRHANPYVPSDQRREIAALRKRAIINLIPLAVSIPSQLSFVAGYRRNGEEFPQEWDVWQKSGFNAKQTSVWTAALTYGAAYVALEGLGRDDPRLRLLSSRNTVCFYEDPVNDAHPAFAMTIRQQPRHEQPGLVVYYDPEQIAYYDFTPGGDFRLRQSIPHSLGETPVRRFTCLLDDEGTSRGVVEMLIPAQDRVNQDSFDRLATQSFSAFKVRWAAGMLGDPELDENGEPKLDANNHQIYKPVPVDQSTWLQTDDPNSRFGTLDETPLDGFHTSVEDSIRHFAVQGQLPPHSLLGNLSNLSAETLVAAMSQTQRFGDVLKTAWAQSIIDLMRLAARDLGLEGGSMEDPETGRLQGHYEGEVDWEDKEEHTLAAQVDALGKGATMLNIPASGLWHRFPGTTHGEVERWRQLAEEQRAYDYDEPNDVESSVQRESGGPSQEDAPRSGESIPIGGEAQ